MQLTLYVDWSILGVMDGDIATARFYKLLGATIARRRNSARLTQAQLAERIGSARTSVTNLERGRQQMPLHQLLRIAEVLEADLKDLIPSRSEVHAQDRISIAVGSDKSDVPPETARLIAKILNEHDEANNDTGSKSDRAVKAIQDQGSPSRRRSHRTKGRRESGLPRS